MSASKPKTEIAYFKHDREGRPVGARKVVATSKLQAELLKLEEKGCEIYGTQALTVERIEAYCDDLFLITDEGEGEPMSLEMALARKAAVREAMLEDAKCGGFDVKTAEWGVLGGTVRFSDVAEVKS